MPGRLGTIAVRAGSGARGPEARLPGAGLTGTALIVYVIVSEGSRIIPVPNLVPVP